jgi:4-hydroxy-2-oxoheptanedioate aldolase
MVEGAPEASRLNRLRQMWDEGRTALGVIATIPSVQVVQALAQTPLDFIVIDMEHGAIDAGAAHAMIVATSGTRLVPLVRIAASTGWHAKLPLDLGAMGILLPDDDANPGCPDCCSIRSVSAER